MARTRTIKPEFWSDEKIGGLGFLERILFIGLWTFSDDEGLCRSNPMYLKSMIFPYDKIKESDIKKALQNLESNWFIYQYKNHNQSYLWVVKFRIYQRIDKPQRPTNPAPSIQNPKYAQAIHKRDAYRCHICNQTCSEYQVKGREIDPRVASIDHIIPVSKNGCDYPTNLKTACISCNKSRGNKDLNEFLKDLGMLQECSENIPIIFNAETETETVRETETETLRARAREAEGSESDFAKFWTAYPKKVGKIKAEEAWNKQNGRRPPIDSILSKIEKLKKSRQWQKDGGQYIPHPTTWINQGRWDDEPEVVDECPGFDWSRP